jgi:F0F1-type ATP synthase assembly protein I
MELKKASSFFISLILVCVLGLLLQSHFAELPIEGILGRCYFVNNLLAATIFIFLLKLRKRHVEKLGFIFLAGSGIKFLAFFLFIYPVFHADGELTKSEFGVFFIPYATSTAVEIIHLARILNKD